MKFEEIKNHYLVYEKKYSLPSFKQINSDFEIHKISGDTDCFLRSFRKAMMEKIVNSLGFFEMLLNPMNAPRIYMPYLKSLSSEDRTRIESIYARLSELSLTSLELELTYHEKGEVALIKQLYAEWQEIKPDFKLLLDHIRAPRSETPKKEKSYFG